jgi:hypothetical protein
MIKKLAVVIALDMVASLSLAGCIKIIERKNNDTEPHYPTLTKEASSANANVIITYPKSIYPLKVSSSDGDRWIWSWKIQFTEVNGTAVTLSGMNHFISSAGVSYGALGQEAGFSNVTVAGKGGYQHESWMETPINSPLYGKLVFECWGTDQYGHPLYTLESNATRTLELREPIAFEVTIWPPQV